MLIICVVTLNFIFIACERQKFEGFIVGGDYATIEMFPHSASIYISCKTQETYFKHSCGASIINQAVSLTAAHCTEDCVSSVHIDISAGDVNIELGFKSSILQFLTHENYNPVLPANDISLLKLKTPFTFGPKISRVVLTRNPPQIDGYVAGWGYVKEYPHKTTKLLRYTIQPLMNRSDCQKVIGVFCAGCLCAGKVGGSSYASNGDSGSALVVNKYIQIGLVSYKMPHRSQSVVVYTDVAYFYNWIKTNVIKLLCH